MGHRYGVIGAGRQGLAAQGRIRRGVVSVERAVPGPVVVEEARRRGLHITERITKVQ
jgi:hypothetical protein